MDEWQIPNEDPTPLAERVALGREGFAWALVCAGDVSGSAAFEADKLGGAIAALLIQSIKPGKLDRAGVEKASAMFLRGVERLSFEEVLRAAAWLNVGWVKAAEQAKMSALSVRRMMTGAFDADDSSTRLKMEAVNYVSDWEGQKCFQVLRMPEAMALVEGFMLAEALPKGVPGPSKPALSL